MHRSCLGWGGGKGTEEDVLEDITHHPQRHSVINRLIKEHCPSFDVAEV